MSDISSLEMIQQALFAFVNADSWQESQQIVLAQQALLLTDDADAIFAALLGEYADDADATDILMQHRALLQQCRAVGIEAAFAELMTAMSSTEETEALLSLVNAFVQCDGPLEVIQLATEHPELLSDEVEALLQQSIAGVQTQGIEDSEAYGQHMRERLMTLRRLRQAMRENEMPLDEVVEAMQVMQRMSPNIAEQSRLIAPLQDFIGADTWAESKRVVEAHPELLTDEALGMLNALIEQAKKAGEEEEYHEFIKHRDLLQQCHVEGIEAAFAGKIRPAMQQAAGQAEQVAFDSQQELADKLFAFIEAETWTKSKAYLEAHPELLTDTAFAALELLIERAQQEGEDGILRIFIQHRNLLQQCRVVGINAAFVAFANKLRANKRSENTNALQPLLDALMQCDSPRAVFELATEHPELLSDEVDTLLQQSMANVQAQGNDKGQAYVHHVAERLKTLRELRQMMD